MKNEKIPWYFQTWLIVISFALWPLYLPPVIGVILIILHYKKLNQLQINNNIFLKLKDAGFEESIELSDLIDTQKKSFDDIQIEINDLKKYKLKIDETVQLHDLVESKVIELENLEGEISELNSKKDIIQKEVENLQKEYIELEEEVLMQSYGFFDPKYDLEDSEAYKSKLNKIKDKQKEMVRTKEAVNYFKEWTVDGSKSKGRKMTNDNIRQALRTFNSECDIAISKVTVNNINSMEKRINNVFNAVNKMNETNRLNLRVDYLNLKYEELYLALEYARKVEEEKEEQRRIKEQIREEEKVRKEINAMKAKVEKEEKHFIKAIEKLEKTKLTASEDEIKDLELKIQELNDKLKEVEKQKEDVLNREKNTRAGYVYVISNVGSFGEDVYKIGVTRRLTPMDRIRELSSASVPFTFDVHAMIFSEDAPALENTLHKTFHHKRVNLINERKEFFKISLDEIKEVIENNHDKTVEFKMTALAEEYRESQALRKNLEDKQIA